MKKIKLLILMLCAASVAMAQGKLKKVYSNYFPNKEVTYYDKNNGLPTYYYNINTEQKRFSESFVEYDKSKLVSRVIHKDYDADFSNKKRVLEVEYEWTYVYDRFQNDSITYHSRVNFLDNKKNEASKEEFKKNQQGKWSEWLYSYYDFDTKNYQTWKKYTYEYGENDCLTAVKFIQFDEKQEKVFDNRYYFTNYDDCRIKTIISQNIYRETVKLDTASKVFYMYDDSKNAVSEKYLYKDTTTVFPWIDSVYTTQNKNKQLLLKEQFFKNSDYKKDEYTYANNKLRTHEYINKSVLNNAHFIDFYNYNSSDTLVSQIQFIVKNGKIDSLSGTEKKVYFFEYNANNQIIKYRGGKEAWSPNYFYTYDCAKNLKTELVKSNNDNDTLWISTYEYFNDSCDMPTTIITENDFSIYPNPVAYNDMKLQLPENQKIIKYEIFNAAGQLFFSKNEENIYQTIEIPLNINALEKGYYYLRAFFDNGESKTKPFVKF